VSQLQKDDKPTLKNNVLPFPSLQAAPKDPPRPTLFQGLVTLLMLAGVVFLLGLTIWALLT
jgi:hypothetical protein